MIGIPVAEHWPTHPGGFVWVRPNGEACVLEATMA
jgi:hypothetical protein